MFYTTGMRYLSGPRVPDLAGCVCTALFAEESWYNGCWQNSYNAFYMQVNGNRWHRFCVDSDGVSWKAVDTPHRPPEGPWQFQLRVLEDSEIVGGRIQRVDYRERDPYGGETAEESEEEETSLNYDESVVRVHFVGHFIM